MSTYGITEEQAVAQTNSEKGKTMKTTGKLTKAQKELFEFMREGAYIRRWMNSLNANLYSKKGERIKPVRFDWLHTLKPFFVEKWKSSDRCYYYTLRPDAQLTDEWREAEMGRQKQAEQEKKKAEQLQLDEQRRTANEYFNEGETGPYSVEFAPDQGGGGILRDGEQDADIHAVSWGSSFNTFSDYLKHKGNAAHFAAMKALVRAANRGVAQEQ